MLLCITIVAARSQSTTEPTTSKSGQTAGVWTDPSTNLMWAAKDNGKDVSWKGALKFCSTLRLGGHADWRLAKVSELQAIFDPSMDAPGRAGDTKGGIPRDCTWHVKGGLFLTGEEWGGRVDGKEKSQGYEQYFDFNNGESDKDPVGWPYPFFGRRALCVRNSESASR